MKTVIYHAPPGPLCLQVQDGAITALYWLPPQDPAAQPADARPADTCSAGPNARPANTCPAGPDTPTDPDGRLAARAAAQLQAYFAGTLQTFDLPVRLQGTAFQRRVWQALCTIPYGQTRSYGQIAQAVGCPQGARAVGGACNRNPVAILVPCHRVVGTGGALTGYAGGLPVKTHLLRLEQSAVQRAPDAG